MALFQGVVQPPSNTSNTDGNNPVALQGKAAELIVAELHGKWYTAAYRGRLFFGMSLIAGVTIPVNTTTSPTFTLFNPLGSGVNVEVATLDIGWPAAATTVVATILGSVSTQTPTSVTSGGSTVASPIGGGGVAQAKLYTAATITAITTHIPLIQVISTADSMVSSHYEFDGRVVLAPGGLITLTSTPVQTGVAIPCFAWAEWPV
jgi:hypothetical protein